MCYNILNVSHGVSNSSGQFVVRVIISVVLVCCDLLGSLSALINGVAVYWVNFNFMCKAIKF